MKKILPILLVNFISLTSFMIILPIIGPIIRDLHMSEWHSGVILGVSGVFWMLFSRFWGKQSDELGRRRTLLLTTAGFMLAYWGLTLFLDIALSATWSIALMLVIFTLLRAAMGAFYAGIPTVCTARIADVTTLEKRGAGMAMIGASSGLAMIIGPFISGVFAQNSLILPMYIGASLPLLSLCVIAFALPKQTHRTPSKNTPTKLTDPRLRLPVVASFLIYSSTMTANICIGFYCIDVLMLDESGAAVTSGYAMGVIGIIMIITQIIMSKIHHISPYKLLAIGLAVAMAGFSIVILIPTVNGLLIGYAVAAVGYGFVFPTIQTIASKSVSQEEQGVASGSLAAAQGLAMVIAPVISTLVYEVSPYYPYALSSICLGVLFIFALIHQQSTSKQPSHS